MIDYSSIIREINSNIPDNTTQYITASKVRSTLVDMIELVRSLEIELSTDITGKEDKVVGKGLSTNDFTNEFETKLSEMPYITDYNYRNHTVTLSDGTNSQVYQLTPYFDIPDYYVGFSSALTDNFRSMTREQLMALVGPGKTVALDPSCSGTWENYILFILKRTDVNVSSATFTSAGGGGQQQLELSELHDNVTIDGITYNVVGRRLGVFNAGIDTFTINFGIQ